MTGRMPWEGARAPKPVTMQGQHVEVSPMREEAVAPLWNAFNGDDSMWDYMGYGPFESQRSLSALLEGWVHSRDPIFFTFDVDGVPLGWGSYLRIDPAMGVIEVGHLAFSADLRRTRAATEAMYLMASHVFDDLGYRRYEWKCDSRNEGSRRAAERLGFVYEGTFRQHMVVKGRNRDTSWFAMTDADWVDAGSAMRTWLDPANHDQTGRQVRRLLDIRGAANQT